MLVGGMSAVTVLTDARALIEQGWTQGVLRVRTSGPVCYCALGAIDEASSVSVEGSGQYNAAKNILMSVIDGPIPVWNDDDDRTQAEVLAAFDRAIELAKGAES